ncbi:MAG: hypothetical protein ACI8QZ_003438 [Chlamydiales bacterium]|jgi:hypothetical protein
MIWACAPASHEESAIEITGPVTFNQHIAPIIHGNCSICHNELGSAPFPLVEYDDLAKRSRFISAVTESRYMPPWIADPDFRHYANERLLEEREIALIREWHEQGAPEGDAPAPTAPTFRASLSPRAADLRLEMPTAFEIPGDNEEYFVTYLVYMELDEPRGLSGMEFIPGNLKAVHHANFAFYAVDDESDTTGFNGPFVFSNPDHAEQLLQRYAEFQDNPLYVDGWVPGKSPNHFKNRMGARFPKKFVLACQVHYAPTPVATSDRSAVDLFFYEESIVTEILALAIGPGKGGVVTPQFDLIEPNTTPSFEVVFDVGQSVSVISLSPHMHLLGHTFKARALTPDGKEIPLVSIPAWDFSWQENYTFDRPLRIPRGSQIFINASFDNTANNPSNPFDPPRAIVCEGDVMKTDNEMMVMTMVYFPLPF